MLFITLWWYSYFPTNVPDNLILREYDVDKTGLKVLKYG